jgi:hypothetical protein
MGYGLGYGEGSGRVWVRRSGRRGRGESSPSSQQPESTGSLVPLLPSCCHPHAATPSYVSRARGSCASGWRCRCFTSLPPPTAWTSATGLTPSPSAARSSSCTKAPPPRTAPRPPPRAAPPCPPRAAPRPKPYTQTTRCHSHAILSRAPPGGLQVAGGPSSSREGTLQLEGPARRPLHLHVRRRCRPHAPHAR